MGLDIYLHYYDDYEKAQRLEAEYEAESDKVWAKYPQKYEQMTDAQKEECRAETTAIKQRLGLDGFGCYPNTEIKNPSAKYPDHYFKVGYFRSSYNESGINRVMGNLIGKRLEDIFPESKDYEFRPDWAGAKSRAESILAEFRQAIEKEGAYRVSTVSAFNSFSGPQKVDAKQALELFMQEKARHPNGGGYENLNGVFTVAEPMQVSAAVCGVDALGTPCLHLIYKADDGLEWYAHALEIVIETCDFALAHPEKEKLYMRWSG
jgi:hypothetical protein